MALRAGGPGGGRLRLFSVRWGSGACGFSVLELSVALLLLGFVVAAIHGVLVAEQRFQRTLARAAAARDAARVGAQILAGELRPLSPSAGDLYAIAPDSLAIRSLTGVGVVCGRAGSVLSLRVLSGSFSARGADSALVFRERDFGARPDGAWMPVDIIGLRGAGPGLCVDEIPPDLGLVVERDPAGVVIGSPVRAFRPYVYKLYADRQGEWWLGQRIRSGRLQPVVGPFAAPEHGGLRFEYLTAGGSAARAVAEVVQVRITLRASGSRTLQAGRRGDDVGATLSTRVYLRNG